MSANPLLIYIPLTGYLRQWLTHALGDPVVFPSHSYENAIIARALSPLPAGRAPQLRQPDTVAIACPSVLGKPIDRYNYFGRRGCAALTEAINTLFTLDLWYGISPLLTTRRLNESIDAWGKSHGISIDYYDAVRKRFYRMRQRYAEHGIIVSRATKRKSLVSLD